MFAADSSDSNGDRLLRTTDGGKYWQPVGRMPNKAFLHFVSMNEAFAGNEHSTDGGRTWSKLPIPTHTKGYAYFHDKDHGWAAAEENKKLLIKRTVDGGKTWKIVMSRDTIAPLNNAVIRSAGLNDAWVECLGDVGMSQQGFALYHTADGGKTWYPVIVNSTAGGGPAPGFPLNDHTGPILNSYAGHLDVVSTKVAFMSGYCPACDNGNNIGWTTDGKTWTNSKQMYSGYGGSYPAFADDKHGWWICTDNLSPSVLYTTSDGGHTWQKAHTFDKPKN